MRLRAQLHVWTLAATVAAAAAVCPTQAWSAQAPAAAQAAQATDDTTQDNDSTLRQFLLTLEPIVRRADAEAFAALEGPLGDRDDALGFARSEFDTAATRVVVQERERQELTLTGIPGSVFALTIDAFIEHGNRARVATWQLYMRRAGDTWTIVRQQVVSSVDNLFLLTLNDSRQFSARNLVITSEDLQLTVVEGTVFTIDTEQGVTGLVVTGHGEMRFTPSPDTEKGQVRIFSGAEVLETRFDAAFIRVGSAEAHYEAATMVEQPVDPRQAKRAQQIFREEAPKSFSVDLADMTSEAWTLLPGPADFLAEVRTRRYSTLTYARASSEPEDITLFDRRRHRNIALYASKDKLAARGRFYNEDDIAPFDVVDYDIDITALPDRSWIDGRARMRLRVRDESLAQLTIRLADSLVVRSIASDRFGRLFHLRVSNQNTVLINLPKVLSRDDEIDLTFTYGGRLEGQSPDRETIAVSQDDGGAFGRGSGGGDFPTDLSMPVAEPSFLYSNRSFWYPQSPISDYATAQIRLTVPLVYGAVASGEPTGPPEVSLGRNAAEGRHIYRFKAVRPARYLSFIVSRFITADHAEVRFGDAAGSSTEDSGTTFGMSVALSVEANPRQTGRGKQLLARTGDIMRFYQSLVGDAPYPSFTIALVENLTPGGHSPAYFAQLNQPLPNSPLVWRNDPAAFENYPEFFMAHEIAHQWWGQGVGWQTYHDQWLSEGFAQYFATLYARSSRGDDVYQNVLRRMRRWAINESDQGPVYLGYRVGHIKNDGRAFRAIVYNKGAMVLHMLRQLVGDEAFFSGVRRFYLSSRFRKVGSEDFRFAMEEATGRELGRFFERWVYASALPQLTFTSRVEAKDGSQVAVLRFDQTGEVFDVPVVVTLTYANGQTSDVVVPVTERTVEFPVVLTSALKSATVSPRDLSLAQVR